VAAKVYSLEQALNELQKDINAFTENVQTQAKREIQILAGQAHSMIGKKAEKKLKSTRSLYLENLDIQKIESSGNNEIWAVVLYEPAKFLEEGQEKYNMIDSLLNSKSLVKKGKNSGNPWVKKGKNGRYAAVPFEHSKAPSQMSLAQNKLAALVKSEMQKQGLDKTITQDGKPVLGRIKNQQTKNLEAALTKRGMPQSDKSFRPLLSGLTIYQREVKMKNGKSKIMKDILTFRMVSDSQKGKGLWDHPGRPGVHLFEETAKELDVLWDQLVKKIADQA